MKEKEIFGRLIQKHDIEENWLKAINFIPRQGEIIIYDADDSYSFERIKIGDGKTTVSNLPFIINAITTVEIDEICVIPVICTMSIEGIEYKFIEGMTWAEWIESKYNTDGYVNSENHIKPAGSNYIVAVVNGTVVVPSYTIVANHQYIVEVNSPT